MQEDSFAEVMREATRGSSEVIDLGSQPSVARMRGTAPRESIDTPIVQMRLVEVDGFLEWGGCDRDGTGTQYVSRRERIFRGRFGG